MSKILYGAQSTNTFLLVCPNYFMDIFTLKKNYSLCKIQIWLNILYFIWQLYSCLISTFEDFLWLFLELPNETLQQLGSENQLPSPKSNFCFELKKFIWGLLQLFSDVFLKYFLRSKFIYYVLWIKTQVSISNLDQFTKITNNKGAKWSPNKSLINALFLIIGNSKI